MTKVGDAGLKDLAKLKKLRFIDLDHTNVTDEGKDELLKALPAYELY